MAAIQKISFKVPPGLWNSFKEQANSLFQNRAPFLNNMISRELLELRADLETRSLSLRAKRHISGELKRHGAKSVNIEVHTETALALKDAVRDHNLVRDAFICRLIIFLRSSDALLKFLDVPREAGGRLLGEGGLEKMPTSPMKAMEALRDDPLFYVRHYVRENWQCGIYDGALPKELDWAACWLDDKEVPGTKAHRDDKKMTAAMFEIFETKSFSKQRLVKKGVKK
jgi:hypothetical protein